jgi:hypothetical protein
VRRPRRLLKGQLREVYDNLPVIFQDTTQLTPGQRNPRPLRPYSLSRAPPGRRTQFDDIMESLDRFLANANSSQLATLTTCK